MTRKDTKGKPINVWQQKEDKKDIEKSCKKPKNK